MRTMSPSSPSLARRNYGAVEVGDDALAVALAVEPVTTAPHEHRHGERWRGFVAFAIGAAVFCLVLCGQLTATTEPSNTEVESLVGIVARSSQTSTQQTPKAPSPTRSALAEAATDDGYIAPLSFTALNFYHIRDGKPGMLYPFLKDVKLIEPHRETTLSVSSPRDGYEYIWEVRGGDEDKADLRATASGAEAVVVLTILDDNMITLKEVSSDGEAVRQLDERVMVKYVRREIRTLTDDEREELLDAVSVLSLDAGTAEAGLSPLPGPLQGLRMDTFGLSRLL